MKHLKVRSELTKNKMPERTSSPPAIFTDGNTDLKLHDFLRDITFIRLDLKKIYAGFQMV